MENRSPGFRIPPEKCFAYLIDLLMTEPIFPNFFTSYQVKHLGTIINIKLLSKILK